MPGFQSVSIYVIGAVVTGLALDWAIVERLKIIVGAFGDHDEVRYHDLPTWRLVVVALSAAIVGVNMAIQHPVGFPFWAGTALFALANIYGDTIALRR